MPAIRIRSYPRVNTSLIIPIVAPFQTSYVNPDDKPAVSNPNTRPRIKVQIASEKARKKNPENNFERHGKPANYNLAGPAHQRQRREVQRPQVPLRAQVTRAWHCHQWAQIEPQLLLALNDQTSPCTVVTTIAASPLAFTTRHVNNEHGQPTCRQATLRATATAIIQPVAELRAKSQ